MNRFFERLAYASVGAYIAIMFTMRDILTTESSASFPSLEWIKEALYVALLASFSPLFWSTILAVVLLLLAIALLSMKE